MPSVRRSLVYSLTSRYALVPLTLAQYVVLARLLTPKEIGIYSVAAALVGLAQVIRDFGVGSFIIQEKVLTDAHLRAALGISLALGLAMSGAFFTAAPLASHYYHNERIAPILRIISLNFLILPFCSISIALLRREMLFGRVALATVASSIVSTIATLTLAWEGYGPTSIAFGNMLANIALGICAWALRTNRKLLLPSLSGWNHLLRFGGRAAFTQMITAVALDINDIVVGRFMGFDAVAMLSRAQGIMNIFHQQFMGAVLTVAYPAFAQTFREGNDMEGNFSKAVSYATVFAWPFYGFVAAFPLEIVNILLGHQWYEAAKLVPIFCAAGALAATFSLINSWLLASGRVDLVMRAELTVQSLRIVLIVVAAIVFRTLVACAVAFLLAFAIGAVVFYAVKLSHHSAGVRRDTVTLRTGVSKSLGVAAACLLVPVIVSACSGFGRALPVSLPVLIVTAIECSVVWLFGIRLMQHPLSKEPAVQRVYRVLGLRGEPA